VSVLSGCHHDFPVLHPDLTDGRGNRCREGEGSAGAYIKEGAVARTFNFVVIKLTLAEGTPVMCTDVGDTEIVTVDVE
jgi:hypothetical protein